MQISIALCTYNGEKFLSEQLESILQQTRLPDELVICDDASQDQTARIVEEFSSRAPFPVRFFSSEVNLGSTPNFERAVSLCNGDIIVLCDQDDRWMPHKLARMEVAFENPDVGLAFSNALVMDEDGRETGKMLWSYFTLGPAEIRAAREGTFALLLLKHSRVTGMTMAIRASWLELLLPVPDGTLLIHDGWFALLLSAVSRVEVIEEPLAFYRQHSTQQVGLRPPPPILIRPNSHLEAHIAQLKAIYARMHRHPCTQKPVAAVFSAMPLHIAHVKRRLHLPRLRALRVFPIGAELINGRYHRFSNGWKSAVRDLLSKS